MAADLNPEWLSCLPSSWSYGVTRDGRIFFINEEAKSTTWLHPTTVEAVSTGHRKTPDLPTGWEEGFTFEGARCFINHNERKVTCKHPVSGSPSQDNCIFVVNEHLNYGKLVHPVISRPAPKAPANEKKERPLSTMSEASNYTGGSDHTAHTGSPVARTSRPSKKVHNFGKRSNSIKRNPNAPVVKSGWLYKQDSTGMKLWKKRWFVLSDMCLFYYRDDKEEGILGSILLPSFHISMLSVEDHISRKYGFKATHPNMRTYYFCTDTAKDMESWMKVMTDAALVHTEPVRRLEKLKLEQRHPQDMNNVLNHRLLTRPEAHNNERNREVERPEEQRRCDAERYGFQKEQAERALTKINSVRLQPLLADGGRQQRAPQVNGSGDRTVDCGTGELGDGPTQRGCSQDPQHEPQQVLQRTNSMQQLEQWVRTQRGRSQEEETRSITSYQTLPRNMPSHRAPATPRYPEGYRTLPRNSVARPDSVCGMSASLYERPPAADKRRSMRDDTMWQLYEWQQRQAYGRVPLPTVAPYGTLPSPRTMVNLSEHTGHSIPPSPSHGSLAVYQGYSPLRSFNVGSRSEVSSPSYRGDLTIERHHRAHLTKYAYPPDRRPGPAGVHIPTITSQSLQGKTMNPEAYRENAFIYRSEEPDVDAKLSRLCEQDKVLRTQEEKLRQLHREKHTLETALLSASQEIEMSAENPAAVQSVVQQRDVLQSGLLSTCRELSRVTTELERSWREYERLEGDVSLSKSRLTEQLEALGGLQTDTPSQQHGQIQKELWRIQDVMEALSKSKPQRSVDSTGALGSKPVSSKYKSEEEDGVPPRPPLPQSYDISERPCAVAPPPPPNPGGGQLHVTRQPLHRPEERKAGQRNGAHGGPDYRLYKSEPELTTVAEVDETNGEEKAEQVAEAEPTNPKGIPYPVGIVSPMPESATIASYVTLRKSKKPDSKTDRPQSAVEQPGGSECTRPRMSLEEQLERIRRHQQALLRDKKKGVVGQEDSAPSHTPPITLQSRKKDELQCRDTLELKEQEPPVEETARHREVGRPEDTEAGPELCEPEKVLIREQCPESSPEEEAERQEKVERIKALIAKTSLQNALPPMSLSPEDETEGEAGTLEQEKMINISYELAAEASKRSKLVAAKSLSSPPQSPTSPSPPPPPLLADGSHFMCV
ncbi:pleckstrin homology domain-containing family A member 5 isoform X18 [Paramormyrops kingsleyae]|uniref:pleckstrin homology domain-containing family A member 5 isoform X18 n=1 Tax=Paramormyrops kingsleyae TaxID=1676925 RepID=UPI003B9726CF